MRAFGKVIETAFSDDWELGWVVRELNKSCVVHTVEPLGDGKTTLVWFEPNQAFRLPYHLGVIDALDPDFMLRLPMYSQNYFYRVDELLDGELLDW